MSLQGIPRGGAGLQASGSEGTGGRAELCGGDDETTLEMTKVIMTQFTQDRAKTYSQFSTFSLSNIDDSGSRWDWVGVDKFPNQPVLRLSPLGCWCLWLTPLVRWQALSSYPPEAHVTSLRSPAVKRALGLAVFWISARRSPDTSRRLPSNSVR